MMNRHTGRALNEVEHLRQSVADILTTPIGSRVMRREYGSQVPMLVDQPDNAITQLRQMSAAASALMRWEPRLALRQLSISRNPETPGKATVLVEGDYLSPVAAPRKALQLGVTVGGKA